MITIGEMKILEENSEFLGVERLQLMENAGKMAAMEIGKRVPIGKKKILVVCYHGNNGGDGFVVARYLSEKAETKVLFIGEKEKLSNEALLNFKRLKSSMFVNKANPKDYDIIIDAILGIGIKGKLKEDIKNIIRQINKSHAFKVSLDVPSGMDADTGKFEEAVKADWVITFHGTKQGLLKYKPINVDIGIPKEAGKFLEMKDLKRISRDKSSYKGKNGKVLIIGGSENYVGAPALAGLAALRAGSDYSVIATTEKAAYAINSISPDLITKKLKGEKIGLKHLRIIKNLISRADVVVIGNGLGSVDLITKVVLKSEKLKVVDADAIRNVNLRKVRNAVITPHRKELEVLLKNNNLKISELKNKIGSNVVLVKGAVDKIIGKEVLFNKTGNEGMTVAGTGDVLAGLVAGTLAQTKDLMESAKIGAFVLGSIGDELLKERGYGFIASDMIEGIPRHVKKLIS